MDWPLDLPAHAVLKLPGETAVPWAVFAPDWYRRTYRLPDAMSAGELLAHYLAIGQGEAHAPNPLFDERWHRSEYPQIAAAIEAGEYSSAYDAYCRRGSLDRSAHWLFSELFYRDRYPDLTNEVFAGSEIVNGYDHYLRHGVQEDRVGNLLFDPPTYLANFDAADAGAIRQQGSFQHYLSRLEDGAAELRTSVYFDPEWYLRRYPEVAEAIAAGIWKSALHHYLCNVTPTEFNPLEAFSEAYYLSNDPGLRDVVAARHFRNGYMHFLRFGARELRSPAPSVDLAWYATQPEVKADIEQGRAPDAFTHWLTIGSRKGLLATRPRQERVEAAQASALAARFAEALLPVTGRFGYRFDSPDAPAVSVILVVRDCFATTMATIASLRASTTLPLELVIVDRDSADEIRSAGSYVPGAKVLRLEAETTWSQAAEAGRQLAGAPLVLFVSSAAQIVAGSIDRALARLSADETVGAVGGMVLQPLGVIAEAGGIVWQDGGTHDYMAGESALVPEANFVRTVDFCSTAFLLVRSNLIIRLDGFDHACAPGYEAVDLCLRIGGTGQCVIYDPSVMVIETLARPARHAAGEHFLARHKDLLARRAPAGGPVQVFARHAGPKQLRILFLEDTVPLRRIGSGFVRSNDIIRAMAGLGAGVTVFPINGCEHALARVFGDMPDTVEIMHNQSLDGLGGFLKSRPEYYDLIWIARAHNLEKTISILNQVFGRNAAPSVILDTEALTPYRDAQRAALTGQAVAPGQGMQRLGDLARLCAATIAVTPEETALLQQVGAPRVFTIGHAIDGRPTSCPFTQRAGMLFVGAIHTADSPNLDSLHWFVDCVLPLIEAELGWETRLTIAGYVAPGIEMERFRHHARITLRGPLPDLEPLYNAHRVFIAPTRYAAGAPYKVFEAAARGIPVVCTEVLRRQLGWLSGQDIVAAEPADPGGFADAVLALYRDEILWRTIRENALQRLEQENGWANFTRSVALALTPE